MRYLASQVTVKRFSTFLRIQLRSHPEIQQFTAALARNIVSGDENNAYGILDLRRS